MKQKFHIGILGLVLFVSLAVANEPATSISEGPFASTSPKLCAAIRGNGGHLMAHFGGLAAVIENYGLVDGISGGSSAAVSVFFYESMIANPLLWTCGSRRCTEEEVRPRLALMLKSIMGGVEATIDLAGGQSIIDGFGKPGEKQESMGEMLDFLKNGFDNPGKGPLRRRIIQRIADRVMSGKLYEFEDTPVGRLINDNHKNSLRNYGLHMTPHRRWEILLAAQGLDFNTEDVSLFFREGLLDYDQLVNIIGRVGDFFANRGPIDPRVWSTMFSPNCVQASQGLTWKEMEQSSVGKSCAQVFKQGYKNYIQTTLVTHYQPSRLREPVGHHMKTLVSNSVIIGEGVTKYKRAYQQYRNLVENGPSCANYDSGYPRFRQAMAKIPFQLNFLDEVRYGYWGQKADLEEVEKGIASRKDDMKSSLFINLGTQSWEYILRRSPAEPGLSKLVPMGDQMYSSGGWSDLHPMPVLKDIGCEKVIYITRTNKVDSEYGQGIVKLFNIPEDVNDKLYNLYNPESSTSKALRLADAVVCSNWNSFGPMQFFDHFANSYKAPIATENAELKAKTRNLLTEPLPGCVAP